MIVLTCFPYFLKLENIDKLELTFFKVALENDSLELNRI